MVILNLEVINLNRAFQQLMLDPFHNDIFAVDQDQNITSTELNSLCPALDRRIEGMSGRAGNFFSIDG